MPIATLQPLFLPIVTIPVRAPLPATPPWPCSSSPPSLLLTLHSLPHDGRHRFRARKAAAADGGNPNISVVSVRRVYRWSVAVAGGGGGRIDGTLRGEVGGLSARVRV